VHPFTDDPESQVRRHGELELLRRIREWLGTANPAPPRGMGDDTAVLPVPTDGDSLLLTNDSLLWNQHFDEFTEPEAAGAKLLKRNLSDIAGMGGVPHHAILALAASPNLSLAWLERFFRGLAACAREYDCEVNGGDLAEAPGTDSFLGTLSLLGSATRPLLRKGGDLDSWIWVTGSLGGSRAGHHLSFRPRLEEGAWLAAREDVVAMMDLTDGLAKDLPALVADGLQAQVDLAFLPLSEAARATAQDTGETEVFHAFTDGEDYELLFLTRPGTDYRAFEQAWRDRFTLPVTPIGNLVLAPPMEDSVPKIIGLDGRPLFAGAGYQHFGSSG